MTKSWVIKYDSFQWWCLNLPEFNFKYSTFICLNLIYSKFKTFLWVFELENRFFILLISFVYNNLQRKSWIRIPDYQFRVYKEKGTHLQRFSTDIGVIFQDIPGIIHEDSMKIGMFSSRRASNSRYFSLLCFFSFKTLLLLRFNLWNELFFY